MTKSNHKFLVSTIIPAYNVAAYLREAIDSIVHQTTGFSENIEIILVDDGSTDKTSDICKEYTDKYPNNIRYLYQKNAGVSNARNAGLKISSGEFIHFFDGDDILSHNYYQEAVMFLRQQSGVDFVAAKIKFFDEIIDSHVLNYKFRSNRVIDVLNEPDNPILHAVTCVFRRSAIEDIIFDEQLSIAEDVKFLSDVLVRKKKYGVLKSPTYHYRRRTDSSSAISGKEYNKNYYLSVPDNSYRYILEKWKDQKEPSVAEYTVLYDLSYRLSQKKQLVLNEREEQAYRQSIKEIISICSDEAIVTNRHLSIHQKRYALSMKHGEAAASYYETRDGVTYFKGYKLYDHALSSVYIDFLTSQGGGAYKIEGYINGIVDIPYLSYEADAKGERVALKFVSRVQRQESFLGDVYNNGGAFEVTVSLPEKAKLSFSISAPSLQISPPIQTGPFTRFGALKLTYRQDDDRLLKRLPHSIQSYPYSPVRHVYLELRMLTQILLNWRLNTVKEQFKKLLSRNLSHLSMKGKLFEILKPLLFVMEAVYTIPRALFLRSCYHLLKRFKVRPLWLVSDRGMAAGDNGEALFRYIMSQKNCPAEVYFVISKQSKDYERIKALGPVLNHGSLRHKLKHLLSDMVISSQADIETTNPFIRQLDHYVGLFNFHFVFLQHGVIRHDLSDWLNRFNKNISIFVTSAQQEYDSILGNPYYYGADNVLLSGLPRYDYLQNKPAKKIILAPTYRKSLAKQKTDKNGARRYDPTFRQSEYRNFYNDFMNDERLLTALKKAGMTGEFYLHPAFSAQRRDFDENEQFKVMQFPYDYKTAFSEGEVLVSDHSSVVFDFAYLKKPTAYAHFDVDTFFEGHTYDKSDFFNDEEHGFGGVYYDYDSLVDGVVGTIRSGCKMEEKYRKRVDKFFYKVDKNNSKRVYDAVMKLAQSV